MSTVRSVMLKSQRPERLGEIGLYRGEPLISPNSREGGYPGQLFAFQ